MATTASAPAARRRRARRGAGAAPYLFLAAGGGPLRARSSCCRSGYAVYLSLRRTQVEGGLIGRQVEVFVGLENYRDALSDPEWLDSLVRAGASTAGSCVPIMLGLALLFALLLDSPVVRLRALLAHRDLPALRRPGRHRLAAVGLPVPARAEPDA